VARERALRVPGFRAAGIACGIKRGAPDLALLVSERPAAVAGVFTRSSIVGAPVALSRERVRSGFARAVVVNSGCSNVAMGARGVRDAAEMARAAAAAVGCAPAEMLVASTGVIGRPLPLAKIRRGVRLAAAALAGDGLATAARAIMTTDTFPKTAQARVRVAGSDVTVAGIAKGSGMIQPDMATMLVFIFTDAKIDQALLQAAVSELTDETFNCITVDSDTSTSDTLLLAATGKAGNKRPRSPGDPLLRDFRTALDDLLLDLALQVIRDGEGATKFVEIAVSGAANAGAARRIGLAIANSPLVKTAIAGQDANWGRIVAAIGKSGERADRDRLQVRIGGVLVAKNGGRVPDYDEGPVAAHMKGQAIKIEVEMGLAKGCATVWTCDLTHGYIDINGSYRS
jgi:glutamate N-acetyltransferase/amino-acid N-acetyltransferase